MKRRTFVLLTAVAAVSISTPFAGCGRGRRSLVRTLAQPDFLSHVCDAGTIREIGAAYRAQTPPEAKEDKLINLLLAATNPPRIGSGSPRTTDSNQSAGSTTHSTTDSAHPAVLNGQKQPDNTQLAQLLEENIRNDYSSGNIVTLKGWVLSLTEARQCALYSFEMQ